MKIIIQYLRIIMPHIGIALIIIAMILGNIHNWRGKAVLLTADKTNVFITKNKEIKIVPYALTLSDIKVDFYDSGETKSIEAFINAEKKNETKTIPLRVNYPYKMGFGQDLYLISYDNNSESPEFCVVELVYDPFQGLFLSGIILIIIGMLLIKANTVKDSVSKVIKDNYK